MASPVDEQRKTFDRHVRELLKQASTARRSLQIFVPAATAVVAMAKGFTPADSPATILATSVTVQILLLILIAIAGSIVLLTDKSATSVVHDAQLAIDSGDQVKASLAEAEVVISELSKQLSKDGRVADIAEAMRSVIDVALAAESNSEEQLRVWFTDLLDFFVSSKLTIFGIADEQWNFSIYLLDGEGNLVCAATRRPTMAEQDAPHRAWREGEGHVGKAYQGRRALVCSDSTDPNVRGFFDAPDGKATSYDADRYRSIAAIPILDNNGPPYGVLVATSEKAGRFRPDEEETFKPLQSASNTLATLVSVYNLKRSS